MTYILGSDPDAPMQATMEVDSVSGRAEANEEHGSIIKMHAIPDQEPNWRR